MRLLIALTLLLLSTAVIAQPRSGRRAAREPAIRPTPAERRLEGFAERRRLEEESLVRNVRMRSIGPTVMSGRVVDIEASPDRPERFYVAYASGGVWRTATNGISFEPIFDREAAMTVGDLAVDWKRGETIWVGTGESNSSRSSYAGTGIYRSTDGGRTWEHLGLAEAHHVGRILLHPDDPNTAWVAAVGHLYSPNAERGVYKTTDGGRSWRRALFVDDSTGAIDLEIDPRDPSVLYAATWTRGRRAWDFSENGPGSGIYRSTDGGERWTRVTAAGSGFPAGPEAGRIGLALSPSDPRILYALLDNLALRPEEPEKEPPALARDALRTMSRAAFLELSAEALEEYLERNGFPAAYTAQSVLEMVREGRIEPVALVDFLEDANQALFDTPVVGAELYRSEDGGASWRRTHAGFLDDLYYSYGYYFGQVRVSPDDPDRLYLLGVPILRSDDGGKTFRSIGKENVHVDHHALWVSPARPGHLINGNDGGVNVSYDDGESWFKANTPEVGQFYTVAVDDAEPYNVYGGLQDNGVWVGPSSYSAGYGWYEEGDYPYDRLLGGDGMQVQVDTRTNDVVYAGFQFGNYYRIDRSRNRTTSIKPRHELGERPLRFNWQAPIHLSRHNRDILYLGSHRFHRSLDRGASWQALSGDLTRGGRPGDVPYGTLTAIAESPMRFGVLYAGSDDGLVHVSRDGGFTWRRVSDALPAGLWVSRVEPSHHEEGVVYVSLNGYRQDHFEPYLYRSADYGERWVRIGAGLPPEPINVVREDPANPNVLYVGTDHGAYVSVDGGGGFMPFVRDFPNVPVHDLAVQSRERELVVGTHGRSLYRADVSHVQALTPEVLASALHLFAPEPLTFDERWGRRGSAWTEPLAPEVEIAFFAGAAGRAELRVTGADGRLLRTLSDESERGLNFVPYDLTADSAAVDTTVFARADDGAYYLPAGTYAVELSLNGAVERRSLEIRPQPERPPRRARRTP